MEAIKRCCLPQCSGLRFNLVHKFPRKFERAEEWRKAFACPRLNAIPHNVLVNRSVCCRHFREEDYYHRKSRALNTTAVPSLNLRKLNELNKCRQTIVEKPTVLMPDELEWLKDSGDKRDVLNFQQDEDVREIETIPNDEDSGDQRDVLNFQQDEDVREIETIPNDEAGQKEASRRCCLPQCSGLRFNLVHKFPRKIERAEEWRKAFDCPRLNATPLQLLVNRWVCCRHFREEDYYHRKSRALHTTAVPSLNLKKLNELNKCRQTSFEKPTVLMPDELGWLKEDSGDQRDVLNFQQDEDVREIETMPNDEAGHKESKENIVSEGHLKSIESENRKEEHSIDFELLLNDDVLKIVDSKRNISLQVNVLWLRYICRCSICYDHVKGNPKFSSYEIQDDVQPVKAMLTEESRALEIVWSDDHTSTYNLNELYEEFHPKPAATALDLLWTSRHPTYSDELQPLQFHDLKANKKLIYEALVRLQTTGVLIIQGIPKCDKESVLRKYLISKLFNQNWDNIISEKRKLYSIHQNTPITNCTFESMDKALQILTLPYYTKNVKIPFCLVDGFRAASQISKTTYELLTQHPMDFGFTSSKGFKYIIKHPVIAMGERILFAPHNIENIKSHEFQEISTSLKNFNDIVNLKENQWNVELKNDTMIIIDNYRICWNINPTRTETELECFYIERKHYMSSLNTLKGQVDKLKMEDSLR